MPDSNDDPYFTPDPSPSRRNLDPSSRVRQIAARANISPDIADDYLKTTQIESGHNVNVRPSSKGALGFGQVMPDRPGGAVRTVGGKQYNLKDPDQNIEAGLRYFAEGGDDPVARRLYYFGGPRAKKHYEATGRIPNISDGNMTAPQYVKATGGFQQKPQDPYFSPQDSQPQSAEVADSYFTPETQPQQGSWFSGKFNDAKPVKRTQPRSPFAEVRSGAQGQGEARVEGDVQYTDADRLRNAVQSAAPPGFSLLPRSAQNVIGEQIGKGATGLAQTGAGLVRNIPRDPFTPKSDDVIAQSADRLNEASGQIASGAQQMARQANRPTVNVPVLGPVGTQDLEDIAGGTIASSPALILTGLGVPAPVAFGLDSYLKASGRDAEFKDIAKETGIGAATGALFEIPLPARMALLSRIGAKLGLVGGGTYGIEKLAGMPEAEARKNAAVNALFAASGAGKREIGNYDGLRPQTERPEMAIRANKAVQAPAIQEGNVSSDRIAPDQVAGAMPTGERVRSDQASGMERQAQPADAQPELAPRHVDLQPRRQRGDGKGQFRSESRAEREQRLAQVNPAVVESPQMATDERAGQSTPLAENAQAPQGNAPYQTGQPVTIPYTRNTEGSAQYAPGGKYNEVVPGRYMVERPEGYKAPDARWEQGEVTFQNPLVVETKSDSPADPEHWKNVLAKRYSKSGNALADAVRRDGYDGIITYDKYGTQEIVDLSKPQSTRNEAVSDRVSTIPPAETSTPPPATAPSVSAQVETPTSPQESAREGKPLPDWVRQDIQSKVKQAASIGISDRIEELSAQRKTAAQVVDAIVNERPDLAEVKGNLKGLVQAVRSERGIPSMDDKPEFEAWLKSRSTELQETSARPAQGKGEPTDQISGKPREIPKPVEPVKPSTTSARKSMMAEDRADLDLPELPPAQRKSWQTSLDNAKPEKASLLADEVLARPRALNDEETASLVVRAQQIKNEHSQVMNEIGKATDPEEIATKKAQAGVLENEFDKLTTATKKSGTEKGRALASQKLTINQDYDLVSMLNRAKAAKGRELTSEERSRYEEQSKRIQELEEKLTRAQEALKAESVQREIDKTLRGIRRDERTGQRRQTRKILDDEFAALKAQLAKAKLQTRSGVQPSAFAKFDPEGKLTPIIAKMVRNRVRAGVVDAIQLVDEIHAAVVDQFEDITKRDVRDLISGYGLQNKDRRSELAKQLATVRSELQRLSVQEDVAAGVRSPRAEGPRKSDARRSGQPLQGPKLSDVRKLPAEGPPRRLFGRDVARRKQLLKQEAELQRRLEVADFSPTPKREPIVYSRETARLQRQLEEIKQKYNRELYRATRSTGGKIADELAKSAGVAKTIKSMGDISAMFRQGGFYALTHPIEGLAKPTKAMFQSFTDAGYRTVEQAIKNDVDFDLARKSGVEFTGVDRTDPRLSKKEEGYIGKEYLEYVPVAKQIANFSERTFVSFLDSQRMHIFKQLADGLRAQGFSPEKSPKQFKAIADLVNIGTGRGTIPKLLGGNQAAPVLNIALFSPRLIASRVELLNKMFNPVAIARMPRGTRAAMIKDNVKFVAATVAFMGLAKALGGQVSTDPDDGDFLKIRFGNTTYDTLTGMAQPMRFLINMSRAVKADATGDETYPGKSKGELVGQFARSKLSPVAGSTVDYLTGKDFSGRKFDVKRAAKEAVTPLPAQDVVEAFKQDGLLGALKATPTFTGIGVQTYARNPEQATTRGEKLARKFIKDSLPDEARTDTEIDQDQKKADLRARARRGEDVSKEVKTLGLSPRQEKSILSAKGTTRLEQDFKRLPLYDPRARKDALTVYSTLTDAEKKAVRDELQTKAATFTLLSAEDQAAVKPKLEALGMKPGFAPKRPKEPQQPHQPRRPGYVFQ